MASVRVAAASSPTEHGFLAWNEVENREEK